MDLGILIPQQYFNYQQWVVWSGPIDLLQIHMNRQQQKLSTVNNLPNRTINKVALHQAMSSHQ